MKNIIDVAFDKLLVHCESQNFKGWDPYDGLNSWIIQKTFLGKSRIFRLAWIQLFKRNPINLRTIFGIRKQYNPKGLGLFLTGYCNLYSKTPQSHYLNKIEFLSSKLLELQSAVFQELVGVIILIGRHELFTNQNSPLLWLQLLL